MNRDASPSALSELASRIAERTGLAGLTVSRENVQRAWQQTQVHKGSAQPDDLELSLREGRVDWDALIDALTIRETYFFRHSEQFDELRRRVVPQLRQQAHERAIVRVWSAGCASGEEAYTLAMVFEEEGLSSHVDIMASDISREALERGRAGQYRDWSLRSLDRAIVARHFSSVGGSHTVHERLRRQISWRQLNLAESSYPSPESGIGQLSLIFCRNVLMFFDAATIARVAKRLWASLLPGGWLFLGPSDPNVAVHADFEVILTAAGLVYRRPPLARTRSVPARAVVEAPPLAHIDPVASLPPVAADLSAEAQDLAPLVAEIRTRCNVEGAEPALAVCVAALQQHPSAAELHHLHALLLWELCRYSEAAAALRRVLYLDGENAIAHFGLGTLLERQGAADAARRSYHNVLLACEKHPPEAPLPLGDGICASGLRAAANGGLERLKLTEAEST